MGQTSWYTPSETLIGLLLQLFIDFCQWLSFDALELSKPIVEMLIGPDVGKPSKLLIKVGYDLGSLASFLLTLLII